MRPLKDSTTFGDGGSFMAIDYDDLNPCPVEVMFAKSEEQAQREDSHRCIYPALPDSKRIYFAMVKLDDSLCISKRTGWEREICVAKLMFPALWSFGTRMGPGHGSTSTSLTRLKVIWSGLSDLEISSAYKKQQPQPCYRLGLFFRSDRLYD